MTTKPNAGEPPAAAATDEVPASPPRPPIGPTRTAGDATLPPVSDGETRMGEGTGTYFGDQGLD